MFLIHGADKRNGNMRGACTGSAPDDGNVPNEMRRLLIL